MLKKILLITFFTFSLSNAFAFDTFVCQCLAKASGVDDENGDKVCSYNCKCMGITNGAPPVYDIKVSVNDTKSTARSKERWDYGSSICHGQYAYKPNLSDPVWRTQVRFSAFYIAQNGGLGFPETVEIAQGINTEIDRTMTAPEIALVLEEKIMP